MFVVRSVLRAEQLDDPLAPTPIEAGPNLLQFVR